MYRYDALDQQRLTDRVAQFRDQTHRYLRGELSDDAFRPLRLQNGLYVLRHAPMLRVAIPYGLVSGEQLRRLAQVSRTYGLGPAHLTTRQNLQFNGPKLEAVPDILAELAEVQLHSIQTSGSCIRGITTDPLAGAVPDERDDPRPWCELLRQWSITHPEYTRLPRKFKIAVSGTRAGRTLLRVHDLGLELVRNEQGELGFSVLVGGGLGRWPMLGQELTPFIAWPHLLTAVEAIVRVYDRHGRRDDAAKGRLKVLVRTLGIVAFRALVEDEWSSLRDGPGTLTADDVARVARHFTAPPLDAAAPEGFVDQDSASDPAYADWLRHNVRPHRQGGYAIVTLSAKGPEAASGELTPEQLEQLADWADAYSFGEARFSQRQNPVLAPVRQRDLHALWQAARAAGLGASHGGRLMDLVACPGGRDCDLSTVETQPVATAIHHHFADRTDLGELVVHLSGCINGCAHHQLAPIGLRGTEKQGQPHFQIAIGGRAGRDTRLGETLGPAIPGADIPTAIETLIATYQAQRLPGEDFSATVQRIGATPFHHDLYGPETAARQVAYG